MRNRFVWLALPALLVAAPSCRNEVGGAPSPAGSDASATLAVPSSAAPSFAPSTAAGPFEGSFVMRITEGKGPEKDYRVEMKGNGVHVESPAVDGKASQAILDLSSGQVLLLDEQQKTATSSLRAPPVDSIPPAITKTGNHETVVGRECEDWNVAEQGGIHESICVAPGIPYFDLASLGLPGTLARSIGSHLPELREKQELPLRGVMSDSSGAVVSRVQVFNLDTKPVDDKEFTLPPGFRAVKGAAH